MTHCSKCGSEIEEHYKDACVVTREEALEYPELHEGELVCVVCFHEIHWPKLTRNYDDVDKRPGDEYLDI